MNSREFFFLGLSSFCFLVQKFYGFESLGVITALITCLLGVVVMVVMAFRFSIIGFQKTKNYFKRVSDAK